MNTKYYVWRRNDGYVAATTYMPRDYPHLNGKADSKGNTETKFVQLAVFDKWDASIVDFIEAERLKSSMQKACIVQKDPVELPH